MPMGFIKENFVVGCILGEQDNRFVLRRFLLHIVSVVAGVFRDFVVIKGLGMAG